MREVALVLLCEGKGLHIADSNGDLGSLAAIGRRVVTCRIFAPMRKAQNDGKVRISVEQSVVGGA